MSPAVTWRIDDTSPSLARIADRLCTIFALGFGNSFSQSLNLLAQ